MDSTETKKALFDQLVKAKKAKILATNKMKEYEHLIKEDICAEKGWRKKGALDLAQVPSRVLLASINKQHKLKKKNQFEADIETYDEINTAIKNDSLQMELFQSYADNFKLEDDAKKEITASKKHLQSKVESNDIDEEDVGLIEKAVELFIAGVKEEETIKLNKKLGKETKPKDLSKEESMDIEALKELIEELGLEDKIKINE